MQQPPDRVTRRLFRQAMQNYLWGKWVKESGGPITSGRMGVEWNGSDRPSDRCQCFVGSHRVSANADGLGARRGQLAVLYDGEIFVFAYRPDEIRRIRANGGIMPEFMGDFRPVAEVNVTGFQIDHLGLLGRQDVAGLGEAGAVQD